MSTNDTTTADELAALQAEAARQAREAEQARAKLAEAAGRRNQTVAERRTEWDRQFLESYDGDKLRDTMTEADNAFVAALVSSDWGAAFVEARKAMWLAIHLTNQADGAARQLGDDRRFQVFNWRDPDLVRRMEKLMDDEAQRLAADELERLAEERDRYAEGDTSE